MEWLHESHQEGGLRLHAVEEIHRRLAPHGVVGTVHITDQWLAHEARRPNIWRSGPSTSEDPMWAEGAGDIDQKWMWELAHTFFADPERTRPPSFPRLFGISGVHAGLLLDASLGGRRAGLVLFRMGDEAEPLVEYLVGRRATWWVNLMIAGLLRADQFWAHWARLADVLVQNHQGWSFTDRPVNAQEVVLRVWEVAKDYASGAATAFEVSSVAIFMPDPDDEYVYALGSHGCELYAYDAGLVSNKPLVPEVGFGLTASYAVGVAYDPSGGPVLVRDIADREALRVRYRDLGFDDASIRAPEADAGGPFQAERFVDEDRREAAMRGPWVFTTQRLPPFLSPSGRNLVVRFQGRDLDDRWATDREIHRTGADRKSRMAALAMRLHSDVSRLFSEGLALWRDGVRDEVLRELNGFRRWDALCQALAGWLSARAVTLFAVEGGDLNLLAWSLPRNHPLLSIDPAELLDSREMRLLQAPLYPRRSEVSNEGFLGWPRLDEAICGPMENVGTIPIIASGRPIGLLRVDGAMSLFAGHIRRKSMQGVLHQHRPVQTPAHVRPVLEEVTQLLALAMVGQPTNTEVWADWSRWVDRVRRRLVDDAEVRDRLNQLRDAAPTRTLAAELVGVHRNTLRRQLTALSEALGEDLSW